MLNTAQFFDSLFNNAKQNAIMILSEEGIIMQVNSAFTTAYGYTNEDLHSRNFRLLYIEKDQITLKPEIELNEVLRQGSSSDENYLVHKDGTPIWVSGESVHVKTETATCIVKVIHNIHAQKQLERYLLSSTELLDDLFESVQSGLLVLDSQSRTIKTNASFRNMFSCDKPITEGGRLRDIPHVFWQDEEIRNDIRNALVNGERITKDYVYGNDKKNSGHVHIASKLLLGEETPEKRLLLVITQN